MLGVMKLKELLNLGGIVSTFTTPYTQDNKIDVNSLQKEIEMGIRQGVSGFLIPCDAAEAEFLKMEEMVALVQEASQVAKGKCLLISNINGKDRGTRMRQCEEFLKAGADALNLNLPFQPGRTEEEYLSIVADMDSLKPKFSMLQDSDMNGVGLPVETIVRAFQEFESVRGVKIEVKNSGEKYSRIKELTNGRMNISCARGRDQLLEAYDRGIHCFMPSGLFKLYVNSFKLYHEKGREAGKKLFYDMGPIMLFTCQGGWINSCFHKEYFKRLGVFKNTYARYDTKLDAYQTRICQEMIDLALKLESRIDSYWE